MDVLIPLAIAALVPTAAAAGASVSVDLLQEALGLPGVRGADLLRGDLHPGFQVEGQLRYGGGDRFALGQGLRLGGWVHEGVGNLGFLSTVLSAEIGLPARLSLRLDPVELGLGLATLPGTRYTAGDAGLEAATDPPQLRLLGGAGLGLSWALPDSPWSLNLSYRAALELSPPAVFDLVALPHSTLGLGVRFTPGREPAPEEAEP